MNKRIISLLLILIIVISFSPSVYAVEFNTRLLDNQLKIYSIKYGEDVKVKVEKNGEIYYYTMRNKIEYIPLQMGHGTYDIKLLQRIQGDEFSVLQKLQINTFSIKIDNGVFLQSNQPIYWHGQSAMKTLSWALFTTSMSDYQKISSAYNYIVRNIKYDYFKINYINTNYIPSINATLQTKNGICYDYATLFAGLMRAQGIPTKVVMGYTKLVPEYHAWNEVLINGKWRIIDTTFDATRYRNGVSLTMFQSSANYYRMKQY